MYRDRYISRFLENWVVLDEKRETRSKVTYCRGSTSYILCTPVKTRRIKGFEVKVRESFKINEAEV